MQWNLEFANLTAYCLVFARMGGLFLLNPLFGRRNLPSRAKMVLILGMTILLTPTVSASVPGAAGVFGLLWGLLQEFFTGFCCSFAFQLFYYMLFFVGDFLDVEFGLSMAKVFDPGTNVQMSLSSTMLNLIFMLYLFATDSHLILIKLFASTYQIVPMGGGLLTSELSEFFLTLFASVFSLVIRLCLPFVAAMFVSEVSMGILMKLVPQIHVFVISVQFKILVGLLLMILFASPVTGFLDNYMTLMFENMERALYTLV